MRYCMNPYLTAVISDFQPWCSHGFLSYHESNNFRSILWLLGVIVPNLCPFNMWEGLHFCPQSLEIFKIIYKKLYTLVSPPPGIEPWSPRWESGVLTTRPPNHWYKDDVILEFHATMGVIIWFYFKPNLSRSGSEPNLTMDWLEKYPRIFDNIFLIFLPHFLLLYSFWRWIW